MRAFTSMLVTMGLFVAALTFIAGLVEPFNWPVFYMGIAMVMIGALIWKPE